VWRPKAIVVNEDDAGATVSAGWRLFSGFADITFRPNFLMGYDTGSVSITYTADIPNAAYYDVYGYMVINVTGSTVAPFTVYSSTDSGIVLFDQSDPKNAGWRKLGTVFLEAGSRNVVRLSNSNIGTGKRVMADAVMLMINRKLSPDVVISHAETGERRQEEVPSSFRLGQNFPNPFNPNTVITYGISETSHITIEVFDLLGRRVQTLVRSVQHAGEHRVDVRGDTLPSGPYFYRMEAVPLKGPAGRVFAQTRRMLVVK
jgi:hypothetical protein